MCHDPRTWVILSWISEEKEREKKEEGKGRVKPPRGTLDSWGQGVWPCWFPLTLPAPSPGLAQKRKQYLFAQWVKIKGKREIKWNRKRWGKVEKSVEVLVSFYPNMTEKVYVKQKNYLAVGGSATNTSGTRYRGRRGSSSSILIRVIFFWSPWSSSTSSTCGGRGLDLEKRQGYMKCPVTPVPPEVSLPSSSLPKGPEIWKVKAPN